eukprot:g12867.t1
MEDVNTGSGQSARTKMTVSSRSVLSHRLLRGFDPTPHAVHPRIHWRSQVKNFLAHVCHMEMYLQGPSRSGGGARFEEAGYAVSALQAGLQFFLEEGRAPVSNAPSAFAYLPPGLSSLPGQEQEGLVRSARAQAVR